jgi:aminoglycoside 3-N-acetyltransferase I
VTSVSTYRVTRLLHGDLLVAKTLFGVMAEVFEEEHDELGDAYLEKLLAREDTWVLAALAGDEVVGGVTAHVLPMTRTESSELFIYDVAVRADHQRRGVGRLLIRELQRLAGTAGVKDLFVPADDEDLHALDFYRALGGVASPVTFFTFHAGEGERRA